jgi:hypothetical protein
MDFSHLMSFINDRYHHHEKYEKLELDQQGRTSQIRRENQKFDEELFRKRRKFGRNI